MVGQIVDVSHIVHKQLRRSRGVHGHVHRRSAADQKEEANVLGATRDRITIYNVIMISMASLCLSGCLKQGIGVGRRQIVRPSQQSVR